jgi:HPt (histidine-containing phosphotransfer) domain-containing protein
MSDAPILDPAVLDDLLEHIGAEAGHAVIELFIGECRDLTAAMAASGAGRESIRRAAHSLKSSAGQLGASALAEAALAVEIAAEGASAELPSLIAVMLDCAARSEAALASRLNS